MAAPFVSVNRIMPLAIDVAGHCVVLAPANASLPRYDVVLMRVLPWATEIEVINGAPAVNPSTPTIPERFTLAGLKWTVLASVYVPPAGVTLTDDQIESML